MKAWIVSDLHVDVGKPFNRPIPRSADLMICAGDVLERGIVPTLRWLDTTYARQVPVIVVAGNHEFYRAAMLPSIHEARAFSAHTPNLHFLENDTLEIDGVAFIGGTLWTDFKLGGRDPEVAMYHAEHGVAGQRMNDYRRIKYTKAPYRSFKPIHAYRKHMETRKYIVSELRARKGQKTVVVTHHAPSARSISLTHRGDPLSPCYASDLDDLIHELDPTMWVHGHIHESQTYHVGLTEIVANPRGYPGERSGFVPDLVVDI